jgi:nitrous oxidase accessory protein NosD
VAPSGGGAVAVSGGAPLLQDLWLTLEPGGDGALALGGGSTPTISDSLFDGLVTTEATGVDTETSGTTPTFEGNTFQGVEATLLLLGPGQATVRGNEFLDGARIGASDGETGLIEGNVIRGTQSRVAGIHLEESSGIQVRANDISGMATGISVSAMGTAALEGNELVDNDIGIGWSSTQSGTIAENSIRGGQVGINFTAGSPLVTGNTVEDAAQRGIAIMKRATPTLDGNIVCGCGANVWLAEGAEPQMGENEICADETAG